MRFAWLACLLWMSIEARADDCERVAVWREGTRTGEVCRAEAVERGLTVIDLGEDWVPPLLTPGPDGVAPDYAAVYRALARERFAEAGLDGELARDDRYLELYGVLPTLEVVRARLADAPRHRCHAAIDDRALAAHDAALVEESAADGRARIALARTLRDELEHDRARRRLADLEALAGTDPYYRRALDRLTALEGRIAAVRAIQAHLACDGLATTMLDGAYTWQTSNAIETFQRGVMILPTGTCDAVTRAALLLDGRERDLRTALRGLRERVAAARGLIEDGTAGAGPGTVLGRALVPEATWRVRGRAPLPDAAGDAIAPATEAAARALGWRDAASVLAFLDGLRGAETQLVAVALPALPAYRGGELHVSVAIDRGDAARRPALTVYATVGERRIALVRWPTTVGGWQAEVVDGIDSRWKASPVGPRIWRDLYVGPSWLPPASTPDRELVRRVDDHDVLAREQMGPSYRAAFGMVAFVHLKEERRRDWDQGIRTHGTGNLASLANGVSHGCHRLLGTDVVRLANFILDVHRYLRRGETPTFYRRIVRAGAARFPLAIDTLGYRIELDPPIPVDVGPP